MSNSTILKIKNEYIHHNFVVNKLENETFHEVMGV